MVETVLRGTWGGAFGPMWQNSRVYPATSAKTRESAAGLQFANARRMNKIIYIVGLVVVVAAVLSWLGLR